MGNIINDRPYYTIEELVLIMYTIRNNKECLTDYMINHILEKVINMADIYSLCYGEADLGADDATAIVLISNILFILNKYYDNMSKLIDIATEIMYGDEKTCMCHIII